RDSTHIYFLFFLFPHPPTPEFYTLSLHDALPIYRQRDDYLINDTAPKESSQIVEIRYHSISVMIEPRQPGPLLIDESCNAISYRSEEHTSELQSRGHLVCRLLLEKKKKNNNVINK